MIDTSSWKKFKIEDLFDIKLPSARSEKKYSEGDIRYVSSGAFNNGVANYLEPKSDETLDRGHCITVSPLDGASFWQDEDFMGRGGSGASISMLYNDNLNELRALFICSVIRNTAQRFGYSDLLNSTNLKTLELTLPVASDGQPDWDYMESYMKVVMEESEKALSNLKKADDTKHPINVSEWGEFRVGDLFDIHPTKAYKLTNAQLLDGGNYPVVANSAYNNGIGGYSTKNPTEHGNMITFSDTVDANTIFYQKQAFVGYPHVQGLYPIKYEDKWNELTYQFFVSAFRGTAIVKGFDYGNKFRRDIAVELMVKLPVTSTGEPDWQYMEDYMKNIMNKQEMAADNLSKIV